MDASSLYQSTINTIPTGGYRAILAGQYGSSYFPDKNSQQESLRELHLLCDTAGVFSAKEFFFSLPVIDPGNFFTSGIIEKITNLIKTDKMDLLVVDAHLKPNQLRNLEETLQIRVIGRIELILDIFAMRARTRAAVLQVELAQLTYILPRLTGLGGVLSRLGGGIGTRGPGETMLETDRRHIRRRIQKIKEDLKTLSKHRQTARKGREYPTFALAGYTNAGKTSLINMLSSSSQKLFAEDRLFATLDSFSRKVYLGDLEYKPLYSIVTDTVGFIRNLPASLVAAFSSTLEEITHTDVIILVLDASSMQLEEETSVVVKELERLKVHDKPRVIFLNKTDMLFPDQKTEILKKYPQAIMGSALNKEGVATLREKMLHLTLSQFIFRPAYSKTAR